MSEARATTTALPKAPQRLIAAGGGPAFGLYAGPVADASMSGLRDAPEALRRRFVEKRWQYAFVATPEMMLALAIVDCGYLSSGICAVFDRGGRRFLVDDDPVLPPLCAQVGDAPGEGMSARLFGPALRARMQREAGVISIRASWAHAAIDLLLDASRAPPPISAIASVGVPGRFDFTQKTVLVPAEGEVRVGNVRFPVRGEPAGLDYTHGLLARDTCWRWAFGSGRSGRHQLAFNFSEGFLEGEGENAIWIDGDVQAAGPVRFLFDGGAPRGSWRVQGADIDLVFQPEGCRTKNVDLKLIRSRFLQPFGTFSGRVAGIAIDGLAGVTEDHAARW